MTQLEGDEVDMPAKARRWGFWYWKIIGENENVYMRRLNILLTPWFSVKLHFIYRPDEQRGDLHDHPWNFLSLVLWGSYVEDVPRERACGPCECDDCTATKQPRWVRWFNWKRAEDSHSITWVSDKPIITLVFCGPVRRPWGFWTKDGWVRHDKYGVEA